LNEWHTLWSLGTTPFHGGNAGEGLLALAALAFGGAAFHGLRARSLGAARVALLVSLGIAGFFVSQIAQHLVDHEACVRAEQEGQVRVVEGVIQDFHPLRSVLQRPSYETFRVGGELVSLPLFTESCGYHRTVVEGGPFREGMKVRLHLWNGTILRVDVAR
jgi:hypothetical protein